MKTYLVLSPFHRPGGLLTGLCLLLALLTSHSLYAQPSSYYQADPDSLHRVLASQRTDTARSRTLKHLVDIERNPVDDLQRLLPLLKRQQRPEWRAYHYWLAASRLPDPWDKQPPAAVRLALDSLEAAQREFERLGQTDRSRVLLTKIVFKYRLLRNPPAMGNYLTRQLAFYLRQPRQWGTNISACYNWLGYYYASRGNYGQAIDYYFQQLDLVKTSNQFIYSNDFIYNIIGQAYAQWGNYAKAQVYIQRALGSMPAPDKLSAGNFPALLALEFSLAELYQHQRQFAAAQQLLAKVSRQLTRLDKEQRPYYSALLALRQSSLLLDQGQVAQAGSLLAQAQQVVGSPEFDPVLNLRQFQLEATWARYYAQSGQAALAEAAWHRAYQQAGLAHNPPFQLDYARQLAAFYQQQGQPARAAPYALAALHLADSLAAQQRASLVAPYEIVRADRAQQARLTQARQQQRQAAAQAQRQHRALLYTAAGVAGLLLLAGVLYAAFRRSQRLAQLVTTQRDQLDASLTELRQTQTQLIQKEKMASLGELTAGIAHEIQNPLNFVTNFADVSQELVQELEEAQAAGDGAEAAVLAADVRQNLGKISEHGRRAAGIVRGMLEHSRQSSGQRQSTDVNALADEYLRLAYHGLRAKDKSFTADLQTDLATGLPTVEAVPGELGRVLLNLFTNAFYAVQQRQRAGEAGYVPTVGVRTRPVGQQVEIQVADNGVGMPAGVQAKIFQPFFTTKPTGEGTGLGLSLSYDIVTKGHGGTLTVESQLGQGSTFTISLPMR